MDLISALKIVFSYNLSLIASVYFEDYLAALSVICMYLAFYFYYGAWENLVAIAFIIWIIPLIYYINFWAKFAERFLGIKSNKIDLFEHISLLLKRQVRQTSGRTSRYSLRRYLMFLCVILPMALLNDYPNIINFPIGIIESILAFSLVHMLALVVFFKHNLILGTYLAFVVPVACLCVLLCEQHILVFIFVSFLLQLLVPPFFILVICYLSKINFIKRN